MQTASARFAATMTGSRVAVLRVESWLAGTNLAGDIPIASGSWDVDTGSKVPERVTLRVSGASTWAPTTPRSPLADKGQRLRILRGVLLPDTDTVELVTLGWVRIQSFDVKDDGVDVEAIGLAAILDDARFLDPVETSGTYLTAARSLVDGMLPVTATVADRAMNGKSWQDNRLDAIYELADTWTASVGVDPNGSLVFVPASNDATDPVVATFTDGDNGTVVSADRTSSRDGVYNAVKATGAESGDVPPVSGVAYDSDPTSPTLWNGPYGHVPMFYSSPLITTTAEAEAAARTRLGNVRRASTAFTIAAAIDPRMQVRDVIRVQSASVAGVGRIDSISLELVPGVSGQMTIKGHLITGRT